MKKNIKRILFALGIITIGYLSINIIINKNGKGLTGKLENMPVEKIVESMNKASKEIGEKGEIDALMQYSLALVEKVKLIDTSEVIDLVVSETLTTESTYILLDVISGKEDFYNEETQQRLKNLLEKNIDENIKVKLLSYIEFTEEDIPQLKGIIENGGEIAFHGLRELSEVDIYEGKKIADKVLDDIGNYSQEELEGAINSMGSYFKNETAKGKINFESQQMVLEKLLELYNNTDDKMLKSTIEGAIGEIGNIEALKMLINTKEVEDSTKTFVIDKNFFVFEEVLKNNPKEDDIRFAIQSMKILPLTDLKDEFENLTKIVTDESLLMEITKVVELIETEGRESNKKWLDSKTEN